ncbi:MAG: hypothetical protein Q4A06_08530 [Cardiobacteriaceae bacterium]|nr:hypothetical protein [Cardiobacteriaceae bacterium]
MLKRILTLVLLLAAGVFGGARIGQLASYWFAPDLFRLYLAPGDYWQRLPQWLVRDDPTGLTQTVLACSLGGGVAGGAIMLVMYYYLNRHRKKP